MGPCKPHNFFLEGSLRTGPFESSLGPCEPSIFELFQTQDPYESKDMNLFEHHRDFC